MDKVFNQGRPTLDDLLREETESQATSQRFSYQGALSSVSQNPPIVHLNVAGRKDDSSKPQLSLISRRAIEEEAKVMDFGARKYDAWNWSAGIKFSRVLSALLRHAFAYADGEMLDPETKLTHMAHVRCCAAFLIDYEKNHPEFNDLRKQLNPQRFKEFARGAEPKKMSSENDYMVHRDSPDDQADGRKY